MTCSFGRPPPPPLSQTLLFRGSLPRLSNSNLDGALGCFGCRVSGVGCRVGDRLSAPPLCRICHDAAMARFARVIAPEIPHHVTARGNRREPIFCSTAATPRRPWTRATSFPPSTPSPYPVLLFHTRHAGGSRRFTPAGVVAPIARVIPALEGGGARP